MNEWSVKVAMVIRGVAAIIITTLFWIISTVPRIICSKSLHMRSFYTDMRKFLHKWKCPTIRFFFKCTSYHNPKWTTLTQIMMKPEKLCISNECTHTHFIFLFKMKRCFNSLYTFRSHVIEGTSFFSCISHTIVIAQMPWLLMQLIFGFWINYCLSNILKCSNSSRIH